MQKYSAMLMAGVATMAVTGIGSSTAQAQQGAGQSAGLETIIVTAQKRNEDLQRVPITITAFEGRTLEKLTIDSPTDLQQFVPGFSLQVVSGQSLPFIRGLGIQSSGPWQEASVATFIDGVYYMNPSIGAVNLNAVERVEVDKGPQGTLFGRNAVGGVISYTTKDPEQTPHGDFMIGYGNYNTVTGNLYYTTGLTDHLAANIAVGAMNQADGWGKNLYTGQDIEKSYDFAVRSKLLFTPSDNTKVTVSGDFEHESPTTSLEAVRGVYPFITTGVLHAGGFYDYNGPENPYRHFIQEGSSVKIEHDFGGVQFLSISAWRYDVAKKDTDYALNYPYLPATPGVGQPSGDKIEAAGRVFDTTETQEFQLQSPASSTIKWVAGAFLLFNDSGLSFSNNDLTSGTSHKETISYTGQKTQSYSGFAQATAPIFKDTRVTAGVRYTSDHRVVRGYEVTNSVANQTLFTLVPGSDAASNPQPSGTWSKPTVRAAVEHDFSEEVLGYLSFNTGFESAYYSISSTASVAPLQPVTIKDYEAGLKTDFFDHKLRLNASVFLYDLNNIVTTHLVNGQQVTSNAPNATAKGTDIDIAFRPVQPLTLTAALEYVDPKYTNFSAATQFSPTSTGLNTGVYTVIPFDANGQQLQYSEKFIASATATYVIPTSIGELSLVGGVTHHSGMHYDNQALNVQPAYTVVDASVNLQLPNERWDVKLWSKNLTNTKYALLFPNTSVMMMTPSAPRTFGLRVAYHWH